MSSSRAWCGAGRRIFLSGALLVGTAGALLSADGNATAGARSEWRGPGQRVRPGELRTTGAASSQRATSAAISATGAQVAEGPAPTGAISGTVTYLAAGVQTSVRIYDASGNEVDDVATLANGTYLSSVGLATGNYYVKTRDTPELVDKLYANLPCLDECNPTAGTKVAVTDGVTTSGIDIQLELGGKIAGTVKDANSDLPIEGLFLDVFDDTGRWVGQASTAGFGEYLFNQGLATGSYYVNTGFSGNYVPELWDDHPCASCDPRAGEAIAVTVGETTDGKDFLLAPGGRVSGTVTVDPGGAPLQDVFVNIVDASGNFVDGDQTGADGTYSTFVPLPAGTYYAQTFNYQGYIDERNDGAACVGGCDPTAGTGFTVTPPSTTSGVNFGLSVGGAISGTIVDAQTGLPALDDVSAIIRDTSGEIVDWVLAAPDGTYVSATGLPTGFFYVSGTGSALVSGALYPGNLPCPFGLCPVDPGKVVSVFSPLETMDIDLALGRRRLAADGFESGGYGGWDGGSGAAQLCVHSMCVQGNSLLAACDPCVAQVLAEWPYCGWEGWDSYCVSQTYEVCGVSSCEWIVDEN